VTSWAIAKSGWIFVQMLAARRSMICSEVAYAKLEPLPPPVS